MKSQQSGTIQLSKFNILLGITIILFLLLLSRLFYLQIIKYNTYVSRAQYSTSKISVLSAPRGIIFDRNGQIIATNKESISLVAYTDKLKTKEERLKVYNILSKIIKSNPLKLKETILKLPRNAPLPIRMQSNINIKEASLIVENKHLLPGIAIQKEPIRYYPYDSLAAHVLGYISQIDENELKKRPERKMGDLVGKAGIEKLFDDVLRGKDGKDIVEVDRYGRAVDASYKHSLIHIEPEAGRNITLTIDLMLQKAVEESLEKVMASGSVVVVNPFSGEVLAIASYPNYNPNIFTKPISHDDWNHLLSNKAFLNRAVLAYPPGSIWKPVILTTALYSMAVLPNEKFYVSDAIYLGNTRFGDWTDKRGIYSLQESLAWSRDTAFYQIGKRLTPKMIKEWGIKLGGGRKSGIEIPQEEVGLIPDEEWKKRKLGEPWYPGNTLHYSIGQGFLLLSPLQASRIYSAIATGNIIPKLQLVKKIDRFIKPYQISETFNVDPKLLQVIREGLLLCVERGTGVVSMIDGIKIAGKTGSAEAPGSKKTHSWFAAYAPYEKPEIVVVVMNEKAGHGGDVAARVSKNIFEYYFNEYKSYEHLVKRI